MELSLFLFSQKPMGAWNVASKDNPLNKMHLVSHVMRCDYYHSHVMSCHVQGIIYHMTT